MPSRSCHALDKTAGRKNDGYCQDCEAVFGTSPCFDDESREARCGSLITYGKGETTPIKLMMHAARFLPRDPVISHVFRERAPASHGSALRPPPAAPSPATDGSPPRRPARPVSA